MGLAESGGFLEWAEYSGNCYGTPLKSVMDNVEAGKQVVLEIDVQGAFQVRERIPDAKLVFIDPPSFEELERRLRERATEDEETIERRLEAAKVELSRKEEYDIQLVNDDLETAVKELVSYVNEQAEETRG
ncbi:MAG: guanylate kinase, partial [Eggerthellaceae bacterium]|nr:guanylate kinase [Eggerthellaceae bacterium]